MEALWWVIIGLALLILELVLPSGFFLFILGVAMLLVSGFVWLGVASSMLLQVGAFCVLAFVLWFFLANKLQRVLRRSEKEYGGMIGQVAVAKERIEVGHRGAGELWGAPWRMENVGSVPVESGSECIVISSDGLILQVRPKN